MTLKADEALSTLRATVETTKALVTQLHNAVKPCDKQSSVSKEGLKGDPQIDVLKLSYDAASLIRAHVTKLSLLIINKPFTPTAICTVLRELASGPLPALVSAVELCDAATYTEVMKSELQWRVGRVYAEVALLIDEIPLHGGILTTDQKMGTGATIGKGSLASTGVVWQACDDLMALEALGIVGLVIKKADQYRDTLMDALEELQEWGQEESDGEDGEGDDEETGNTNEETGDSSSLAQDAIDSMFNNQRHIPQDDTNKIRKRLESSLRRLRLMIIMYQAVIKRRFRTLPALPHPELPVELKKKSSEDPGIIVCLDGVLKVMKTIPDIADELANAFYELNTTEIDKRMDECFFAGFAAVELLVKNWEGEKDDFSTWAYKFQLAMKKGW
ncbi:MAG: hypothetical protein M1818_002240 [Claussenomyces sp. TS43310]|nr:MAG: hypothetical protein M1818_002240 [Claussenomyces sp. TS43310]